MSRALHLFRTAFRNSPDNELKGWAYSALSGMRDITHPDECVDTLTIFTAHTLGDTWTRPKQAAVFVGAIHALISDDAGVIVRAALKRVWEKLGEIYETEPAVTIFLHIISLLDDTHRQYGTQLILE